MSTGGIPGTVSIAGSGGGAAGFGAEGVAAPAAGVGGGGAAKADCATRTTAAAAEHNASKPLCGPLAGQIGSQQSPAPRPSTGAVHNAMRNQRRTCWGKETSELK